MVKTLKAIKHHQKRQLALSCELKNTFYFFVKQRKIKWLFIKKKIKSSYLPLSWTVFWTVRTLYRTNQTIKSLADPLNTPKSP